MTDENLACSFCGKERKDVDKLIAGPNVYICNECISISYKIVADTVVVEEVNEVTSEELPTPLEIKKYLDEYIIGHEEAKQMLAVSSYNHYKRLNNPSETIELEKSNVLLVGPTGSGKTLFAKTLAKKLDVPFAIADATSLTESGYVGEDVESILERLLSEAEFDIENAQRGIVYIDEIDKKARKTSNSGSNNRDVSGEGVQQALLRLIEGTVTKVKVTNHRKLTDDYVEFDTTNVLFILGGAFVGIEKIIDKRNKQNSNMGFSADIKTSEEKTGLLTELTMQDIVSYGIIPELMGRVPVMGVLDRLDQKHLRLILTNVKNNITEQVIHLLSMDKITLVFEREYLDKVAELAYTKGLGARSLKSTIEQSLMSVMFRAPELQEAGVRKIVFNKYPVHKGIKPMLHYAKGRPVTDKEYTLYRGRYEEKQD